MWVSLSLHIASSSRVTVPIELVNIVATQLLYVPSIVNVEANRLLRIATWRRAIERKAM
jgi:hypothetical protein